VPGFCFDHVQGDRLANPTFRGTLSPNLVQVVFDSTHINIRENHLSPDEFTNLALCGITVILFCPRITFRLANDLKRDDLPTLGWVIVQHR
jgi:hypothetical protein